MTRSRSSPAAAPFQVLPALPGARAERGDRRAAAPRARLIPFQEHVLANGLEVVLHEDRSEPVVAVYVYYHVGSSREAPGKSGFAHLFEHMLFQGSAHVGDDGHFRMIQEAGGTLNGTTNQDRTNYFETLPSNQLELALWLESDRMGFLLPAMTQEKLDNQREVVKNERRQTYENRPYGLVQERLLSALYPSGHPYSWPTIGSMEDLERASLEDVAEFFRRWYGPNNATLAIGGDIDPAQTLALVERYFGALPGGPPVERPAPQPAGLAESRRLVLEDRVQLEQLTLCWPTVEAGHPDEAALDLLADVLSANKSSLLDRVLILEEQLAGTVTVGHSAQERAGYLALNLRPNPGVTLDRLETRVDELCAELVAEGVDAERLARLQNRRAGELFRSLETVAARTSRLGFDNLMHGDPAWIEEKVARERAVTAEDVARVARLYLVDRPRVVLSTVPQGQSALAASDKPPARRAPPLELERALRPAAGEGRSFRSPPVWTSTLGEGVAVLGTPFTKVPLTRLSLSVPAGRMFDAPETLGLARLTAEMLEEGTRQLSSTELTDALDGLGAQLAIAVTDEEIVFRLSVLDAHLEEAAALLADLVLEPRLDPQDFERLKRQRLVEIGTRADRIHEIADDAYARLVFGGSTGRGAPRLGTAESVEHLSVERVRSFWSDVPAPKGSRLCFVGEQGAEEVARLFEPLAQRWKEPEPSRSHPSRADPARPPAASQLHLIDKPGAAQSELRIGHLSVASTDPDFYPLQALNYALGGSFSSRLNMNLREDKGYTYGARSAFEGGATNGPFTASAGVHTRVTAESVSEALKELRGIREGVTPSEVEFTRKALSQSLTRNLESAQARLTWLENIARFGYPLDYLDRRLTWLGAMTVEELGELARRRLHPDALVVLVVGDRAQVLEPLRALGLGPVQELDLYGRPR